GDQIAAMVFNLTGCPAGTINLIITASGGSGALLSSDSGANETVGDGLSVVNGAIDIAMPQSFWTVAPCRVIDTRNPDGPQGGPALAANTVRSFPIANSCGIPPSATAVAVNIAVVVPGDSGDLRVYPAGGVAPLASAINFRPGIVRANNAIVPLGTGGQISV